MMINLGDNDDLTEARRVWEEFKMKPELIPFRDRLDKFNPFGLYKIKGSENLGYLGGIMEDGTFIMTVSREFNLILLQRNVTGILEEDLELVGDLTEDAVVEKHFLEWPDVVEEMASRLEEDIKVLLPTWINQTQHFWTPRQNNYFIGMCQRAFMEKNVDKYMHIVDSYTLQELGGDEDPDIKSMDDAKATFRELLLALR